MKKLFFFLTASVFFQTLHAQTTEDSVKAVINQLFTGMKNSDAVMIRSAFADSAVLQSIARNREGKMVIENDNIDDFA